MTMDYSPGMPNGVSSTSSINLPGSASSSQKAADGTTTAASGGGSGGAALPPRVDLEPIYDGLRAGLTVEQWIRYKEALSGFVMGRINRQELALVIDPIITGPKQRLHNQLLLGMYQNTYREPPPAEVAPWVLATNKATNALGGVGSRGGRGGAAGEGGDAKVEARLKVEVMALAGRDRRRIKEVPDLAEIEETLPSMLYEYHQAKQLKIPEVAPPQSATTTALNNKTNWEAEIKTRYTLPLASESGEFPDLDQIRMRMLPICYEEGVIGGMGDNTAHFMNVAAEVFVKEILSQVISRVRCNRPTTIKTDAFKRKLELEEEAGMGGMLGSGGAFGLPPQPSSSTLQQTRKRKRMKLDANGRSIGSYHDRRNQLMRKPPQPPRDLAGERKVLGMNDLRLSFTISDPFLTQLPLSLNKIMAGGTERPDNYYDDPPVQLIKQQQQQQLSLPNTQSQGSSSASASTSASAGPSGAGAGLLSTSSAGVGLMKPPPIPFARSSGGGLSNGIGMGIGRNQPNFGQGKRSTNTLVNSVHRSAVTSWGATVQDIPDSGMFGLFDEFDDGSGDARMGGVGDGGGVGWDVGGWEGGGREDRNELRGLLDECLSVGI